MTAVTVSADDLRTVLDQEQEQPHRDHRRPSINPPEIAPCAECAARDRLRSALWSAGAW